MSLGTITDIASAATELWAVYGVINIGFVMLYRTTGVLNFAQGQLVMFGAFLVQSFAATVGYASAIAISIPITFLMGVLIYYGVMRLFAGAAEFTKVIATLMVGIILEQLASIIWGPAYRSVSQPKDIGIHIGQGQLSVSTLVSLALVLLLAMALAVSLSRTVWGIEMRAVAQNERLAAFRGIRVNLLSAIAWGLVFGAATIGAIIYVRNASVSTSMASVGFAAFPALVIGGIDSIGGAIIGSAILGAVTATVSYYVDATIADAVSYALLLVVLFVLPYGIFGRAREERL
jgi:branched-chain amino acid transport system permease protein